MTKLGSVAVLALVLSASGCDKIPFLGKKKAADSTQMAAAKPAAPAPTPAAPAAKPTPPPPPAPKVTTPAVDEPWTPTDTGTVQPGMTHDQVIGVWGTPATERSSGPWTYLYYRNGCEASCGTFDVVFLENGQVVDAIVRWQGHVYGGVSSSPANRAPQFTPPAKGDSGGGGQ